MAHLLVVNTGSSSLKLTLLDGADEVVDPVTLDRYPFLRLHNSRCSV